MDLWDDEAWPELACRQVQLARASGALSWLPLALDYLAGSQIQAGQLAQAAALLTERESIDPGIRAAALPCLPLLLAAWRGDAGTAADLAETLTRSALARGAGAALSYAEYAEAVLHNGLGNYRQAAEAARCASQAGRLSSRPGHCPSWWRRRCAATGGTRPLWRRTS